MNGNSVYYVSIMLTTVTWFVSSSMSRLTDSTPLAKTLSLWKEPILFPMLLLLSSLFFFYRLLVYPLFLSPLAKIPNAHPLSPITQLWMHWRRYSGREVETTYVAFQQKGPVVRLGPNELAVNTIHGGVRTAHGHGWENFDKSQWYDYFVNHG